MHIYGVFGNAKVAGNGYNRIFQIENSLLVQQGNDFLVFVGRGDGKISVNRSFCFSQCAQ